MVRPDGLVKVLDFGIAKLIERPSAPQSSSVDVDEETVALEDIYATKIDPYAKVDPYKTTPASATDAACSAEENGTTALVTKEAL